MTGDYGQLCETFGYNEWKCHGLLILCFKLQKHFYTHIVNEIKNGNEMKIKKKSKFIAYKCLGENTQLCEFILFRLCFE